MDSSRNGRKVYCVVTDKYGNSVKTNTVTLAMVDPIGIVRQPQNPSYPEYSNAKYSVTAYGENLNCIWYLYYEGKLYNISDTSGSVKPWEVYAGETYGAVKNTNGNFTTFTYFFGGIEEELSGAYIYAVIEDGHYSVTSDRAYIDVVSDGVQPPTTVVAASMEVYQNEILDLYCEATSTDGTELSYLWYETSTGDLQNIIAVNRGSEDQDTLRCDTSRVGTRYYVCMVCTKGGGSAYTSVIPVTVIAK